MQRGATFVIVLSVVHCASDADDVLQAPVGLDALVPILPDADVLTTEDAGFEDTGTADAAARDARPDQPDADLAAPCRIDLWPQDRLPLGWTTPSTFVRRAIRIQNREDRECSVAVVIVGRDADAFGIGTINRLEPDETEVLTVGFIGVEAGDYQAVLEINGNQLALSASIGESSVSVSPESVWFRRTQIQCLADDQIVVATNIDSGPIQAPTRFLGATLLQAADQPFVLRAEPPPTDLVPGDDIAFEIGFLPTSVTTAVGALRLEFEVDGTLRTYFASILGTGVTDREVNTFEVPPPAPTDIVVVIDNSPSMANQRQALQDGFQRLHRLFRQTPREFVLGVTTTDTSTSGEAGRLVPLDQPTERLVNNDANHEQRLLRNIDVGAGGDHTETPFEALLLALTPPLILGHNAGVFNPNRLSLYIVASDADDQSLRSTDFYLNFLLSLRGFGSRRRERAVSLIHPLGDPFLCAPGPTPPASDFDPPGPQQRLRDLPNRLGGLSVSMCDPSWPDQVFDLLDAEFGVPSTYFLSGAPVEGDIAVYIDDVFTSSISNGQRRWAYDDDIAAIVFERDRRPPIGSDVRIEFRLECR